MTPKPSITKHFSTSILLWVRADQPRQTSMDYWKGPHSGIIAATPGLHEYRQIHLAEHNPGLWPATEGVETRIPDDQRADGLAEVTFESPLSPLAGRAQTALAYEDEINVFRRTLLYAGPPNSSRWYDVARGQTSGSRALVYLRRRPGTGAGEFHRLVKKRLVPALLATGALTELRTQVFLPWNRALWNTPNVAHDNPKGQRLHGSLSLGFADAGARAEFFDGAAGREVSALIASTVSAVHAYDVTEALTFVTEGKRTGQPLEG
jgi:hypothetical protein